MTAREIGEFLRDQRICRVATVGRDGRPHNTALWFIWDDGTVWLCSIVASQRWIDLVHNPQASVLVDDGDAYAELRGVELRGQFASVGEVPRASATDTSVERLEGKFAAKYLEGRPFAPDGRHAWLRLSPVKIVSWDFRKIGTIPGR